MHAAWGLPHVRQLDAIAPLFRIGRERDQVARRPRRGLPTYPGRCAQSPSRSVALYAGWLTSSSSSRCTCSPSPGMGYGRPRRPLDSRPVGANRKALPRPSISHSGRRRTGAAELLELVEANQAYNATLRLAIVAQRPGYVGRPLRGPPERLIALTADSKSGAMASSWRTCGRPATPRAFSPGQDSFLGHEPDWLESVQSRGFDEAILLNERGEVAECTSATYSSPTAARCGRRRSTPAVCPDHTRSAAG